MPTINQILIFVTGAALSSFFYSILNLVTLTLWHHAFDPSLPSVSIPNNSTSRRPECEYQAYTTQIISLDPLLIYIENLISSAERAALINLGTPLLEPSPVTGYGPSAHSQARTSHSAPLPGADPAVSCVLNRAEAFLGTVLEAGRDEIGQAQMVRYTAGQKFDTHYDWFARPRVSEQDIESGRRRMYNRVATFFAVLQCENCTEGETWFPRITPVAAIPVAEKAQHPESGLPAEKVKQENEEVTRQGAWRRKEQGGIAFRPVPGNAVFWVNLFPNGTGDTRTLHAGLPIGQGVKTAMNIWPRVFFGPDA